VSTAHTTGVADGGERVRFFPRQLLGADDLATEQNYHRQRLRDHNRYLHGWGVVCGCDVQPGPAGSQPWEVRVCPGYVLTACGDAIAIHDPATFDIATCVLSSDDPCAHSRPCPPIGRQAGTTRLVYLAVRYVDCHSSPVRVAPAGCSCDDVQCEHSRIRDGYELCCLAELPASHAREHPGRDTLLVPGPALPCPEDCDEWVILATITLPAADSERITQIDLARDRRPLSSTRLLQEIVGGAVPQLAGAWHAADGDVYHDDRRCPTGKDIEPLNVRPGTGGHRLCEECQQLHTEPG